MKAPSLSPPPQKKREKNEKEKKPSNKAKMSYVSAPLIGYVHFILCEKFCN